MNGVCYSSDVLAASTTSCVWLLNPTPNGRTLQVLARIDGRRCAEGRVGRGLDSRRSFALDAAARPMPGWYVGCTAVVQGERRTVAEYDGATRVVTLDADLPRAPRAGDDYALERDEAFFQASRPAAHAHHHPPSPSATYGGRA